MIWWWLVVAVTFSQQISSLRRVHVESVRCPVYVEVRGGSSHHYLTTHNIYWGPLFSVSASASDRVITPQPQISG